VPLSTPHPSRAFLAALTALALAAGGAALAPFPSFEPVQPALLGAGGTLVNAWADADADGDLDLFVGFDGAPNRLYRNDAGTLVDVAADAGLADARPTRAAAWGDYDADGDPDLLVGFAPARGEARQAPGASVLRLYRNDGGGRFADATAAAGLAVDSGAVRQPVWVDVDADGDLDLFVAFRDRANMLFRNTAGRLADIAAEVGLADTRRSVGAVWFDHEADGDLDVYVGNMDGDANALFRNVGGRFTDVAPALGLAWGGRTPALATHGTVRPCAADVDGDGRLDLVTANYGPAGLFLGRAAGRYEDVSARWGVAVDSRDDACALADVDHDGRLDLYVNGTVTGGVSHPDRLFRNTGAAFEDVTPANVRALHADHGVQWADFDADGDVDLALTGGRTRRDAPGAAQPAAGSRRAARAARRGRGWARAGDPRRRRGAGVRRRDPATARSASGGRRVGLRRAERDAGARRPADRGARGRHGDLPGCRAEGHGACAERGSGRPRRARARGARALIAGGARAAGALKPGRPPTRRLPLTR
jgi:hypothetical protein